MHEGAEYIWYSHGQGVSGDPQGMPNLCSSESLQKPKQECQKKYFTCLKKNTVLNPNFLDGECLDEYLELEKGEEIEAEEGLAN